MAHTTAPSPNPNPNPNLNQRNIAFCARGRNAPHLLLNLPHGLKVGTPVEGVPPQQQQLDQIFGQVPPRHVQPLDLGGEREALVHRNNVRDT